MLIYVPDLFAPHTSNQSIYEHCILQNNPH